MQKTVDILKNGRKIAILPHIKPDGDCLGSAFALCAALRFLGKEAYVVTEYDIVGNLAVLCEGNDMLTHDAEGYDTVVAVDVADRKLLGSLDGAFPVIDLCIDHHKSNRGYASHTLLDSAASAAGEIIFELLPLIGAKRDSFISTALYIAISTDTGCFKYSNTTSRTFAVASEILPDVKDRDRLNLALFTRKSRRKAELEKKTMENMRFYFDSAAAVTVLTLDELEGASPDDIDGLAQLPVQIEGVEAGITVRQEAEKVYKVSMRSNEYVDVSAVCLPFGGGGHARAAGCTVEGDIDGLLKLMLDAIEKQLR